MPVTAIRFYKAEDSRGNPLPYGYLSNFSKYPIYHFGVLYKTAEHYYQSHKFLPNTKEWDDVINASTAAEAFRIGRNPSNYKCIRSDWDDIKLDVMYDAIILKFSLEANAEIREQLLSTDDIELIEASPTDNFWGAGVMGNGANRLGQILMRVRTRLRTGDTLKSL